MSDFQYWLAIFGYKRLAAIRKSFRLRQAAREKLKKKFDWWDWTLRLTVERWFRKLPQKPEINLVWRGYKNKRHVVECYPGKPKGVDEGKVKAIEEALKDYKQNPREIIDTYIYWVIKDAADAGHIHDLSDTTNPIVAGLFHGYKISYASGKDSPLADIDRSNPWRNEWVYSVHGATIPNPKLWEDNRRYTERKLKTAVIIDQPEDCPDAIRIRPRKRIKAQALPKTGGTHATDFVFGIEAETRKKISIPIKDMRHTFGIGTTGAGKTAFLEGLMMTALNARQLVEAVYYIDVAKKAAGLDHVQAAGAIFAIELEEAFDVINTVWDTMQTRNAAMKKAKRSSYEGRNIFVFIDEAAQVFDHEGADKAQQAQVTKRLIRLSQLARAAGIRLITFTQRPTLDFIPSSYLDNHDGRICQRVLRMRTATDFINIDFELNPTRFADGEFAMLWPGWLKERYGRGFISDKMR